MEYRRTLRRLTALVAGALALLAAEFSLAQQVTDEVAGSDWAILTVEVPAEAKVIVNEAPTRKTGTVRRFYSVGLTPGLRYPYDVRVELTRDGWTQVQSKRALLRAGETSTLRFLFKEETADAGRAEIPAPAWTRLSLTVPPDAVVYIDDREMPGVGSLRHYRTMRMAPNDPPSDHQVRVVVRRRGQATEQQQSVAIAPGQLAELSYDFSDIESAGTGGAIPIELLPDPADLRRRTDW